jgi:glycosyltransferase involved in cell wall biosynthesis
MTALSVRRSRRVIAVSDYAGKSLTFGLIKKSADKLSIIHHGIDPLFTPATVGPDDPPFLLAVGDLYLQKNFETLIEAFALVTQSHPHLILKIAGRAVDENYRKQLETAVQRLGLKEFVEFLGEVGRDDLVSLYQRCRVFVFPSLVETFGQPLAEAMACGATIASSRTTAMPEIVGDAALFFDPLDAQDMAQNIVDLLEDDMLSRDLATRGALRAKKFSWDDTARHTADVLVSVD